MPVYLGGSKGPPILKGTHCLFIWEDPEALLLWRLLIARLPGRIRRPQPTILEATHCPFTWEDPEASASYSGGYSLLVYLGGSGGHSPLFWKLIIACLPGRIRRPQPPFLEANHCPLPGRIWRLLIARYLEESGGHSLLFWRLFIARLPGRIRRPSSASDWLSVSPA